MTSAAPEPFRKRYASRVLLPGAVILILTGALCWGGIIAAGRGADKLSLDAQKGEVFRAATGSLDRLTLAQESIALCEECIKEAGSPSPDGAWLNERIASPLFDLYDAHETYIIDANGRPVHAAVRGRQAPPSAYERVAPALDRFVKLTRGKIKRASGKSNLNERLPGAAPEPFVLPPLPGYSEPLTFVPTVKTSPDVVHSSDLVRIGDRVALASVMRMGRTSAADPLGAAPAPLLVNLRYLDADFLKQVSSENFLINPRLSDADEPTEGEASVPILNSDGVPLTNLIWKPQLLGHVVAKGLLIPAAGMFIIVLLMIFLMSLKLRRAMRQDEDRMAELKQAHFDLERTHVELKAQEAQAHHLAYHDVLTGLANRALFNDKCEQALTRARHGEPMAILLLDLDRFKNVNDRFGHLVGDALIQEVGKRLSRVLDAPNVIARLGGDEFAILLEQGSLVASIESTLEGILHDLQQPYDVLGNQAHIGVSIGVVLAPDYGTDRTDLMRKADIALYRAKDEGRNCYRFFTEAMDETVQLRAGLESDLRHALDTATGLSVHYQPLIDSKRGKVGGLEALLRWDHPTRGSILPQMFVPVAEQTGLIGPLGDWVIEEACKVAKEWPELSISVNLSPIQFCDEGFAERTCELVREAGIRANQIEFEVTESVVLDRNDSVRGALRRLRSEGFRIALDDFGTGYSSLSYLRDFEIDRIKIDRSFVQGLGHTNDADAIVTAVVTLGHAMGLQVTAEGVETSGQEDFLRAAGCNVLQGFLFSRAVPSQELQGSLRDLAVWMAASASANAQSRLVVPR